MAGVTPRSLDTAAETAGSAVIPPHLVRLTVFLVEHAVKDLCLRNGSLSAMPDLPDLLTVLHSAAPSARGRPSRILDQPARARYLTTSEAAAVMQISARRVRHHAASGRIIARRAGRDWLIDADSARGYRRGPA
jgi:excisionase family DNA binding protein